MFGLTIQERKVILFLSAILLLGAGIEYFQKRYAQIRSITAINHYIGKVDINQADKETLISLPGIGEKLAQRIIAYRQQNSGFLSLEELTKVKGMTNYRYERLKEYIYVK